MVRQNSKKEQSRKRGAALITALLFTLIVALLVGGGLLYVSQNFRLATVRRDSEAALLLAESGVNDEFNYIANHLYDPDVTKRSSQPNKLEGEPYVGRHGKIPGLQGDFWVYTSRDPYSYTSGALCYPWTGGSTLYITCNAVVNGAWRRIRVGGNNQLQSVFNLFALFGLDAGNNNNQPSIGLTGNADVDIVGTAGTNGHVQKGSGTIHYTRAINYNTAYYEGTPKKQFEDNPVFGQPARLDFPTVTKVVRYLYTATSGMTDSAAWSWLKNNRQNSTKMLQYKADLPLGAGISPGNVTLANYPTADTTLVNKQGNKLGHWENINAKPGSKTVRTLILPPADYYFENIDLGYNANTELVIDNAGLSVGGNPTRKQVRIFLSGSSSKDTVQIPIVLTNPNDASTFRIYDNKDGSVFELTRDTSVTGTYMVAGCIYAVTAEFGKSSLKGTEISVYGGSNANERLVLLGSLLADRVSFNKFSQIVFADTAENNNDPPVAVGFLGGYWEE